MKAFLDTSVLVAAFYGDHERHESSIELFLRCEKREACCAAHSLAEVYSALTGMPGKDRVSGDEAMLFLGNVRDRLTIVSLTEEEYVRTLESAAAQGIVGGAIYDALIGHCAAKANAKSIYTWNVKHFMRLGLHISQRVKTP